MKIVKDHIWFGQYCSNFANYGISHSHGQLREVFGKDCAQYRELSKYLSLNDISQLAHFKIQALNFGSPRGLDTEFQPSLLLLRLVDHESFPAFAQGCA
jgi:hypothetical protein